MSRIAAVFEELRQAKQKAVIPYVSCGYPNLAFTEQLVLRLAQSGADCVELGVPYSDPVADGPTIQRASSEALKNGMTLEKIFGLVERLRGKTNIPLILMTYYNPIYVKGVENFVRRAAALGVDGLIIPDVPVEESEHLQAITQRYGVDLIFLVAPTSTPERIARIVSLARGFVYCVSVVGITGARKEIHAHLESFLAQVRKQTDLPLAVGFGISDPTTAQRAAAVADGVIVGSALLEKIAGELQHHSEEKVLAIAAGFIRELIEAVEKV